MRAAAPGNLDELHGTSLVCGARDTSKVCQRQGVGPAAMARRTQTGNDVTLNLPSAKRD
jgi:hypothetical protein